LRKAGSIKSCRGTLLIALNTSSSVIPLRLSSSTSFFLFPLAKNESVIKNQVDCSGKDGKKYIIQKSKI
jgi:hypothetical protein